MFKRSNYIKKCEKYCREWDAEMHGFVTIQENGRLVQTNNKDKFEVTLDKPQFISFIQVIKSNT